MLMCNNFGKFYTADRYNCRWFICIYMFINYTSTNNDLSSRKYNEVQKMSTLLIVFYVVYSM